MEGSCSVIGGLYERGRPVGESKRICVFSGSSLYARKVSSQFELDQTHA